MSRQPALGTAPRRWALRRRVAIFLGGLAVTLALFAATLWFVRQSFEATVIDATQTANASVTQAFINENWTRVRDLLPREAPLVLALQPRAPPG